MLLLVSFSHYKPVGSIFCRDDSEENRAAELYYKFLLCNLFSEEECLPPNLPDVVSLLHSPSSSDVLANREWMEASIDGEQAEALLYLALYFHYRNDGVLTDFFCAKLLGFQGPEGDEARLVMKSLRSEVTVTSVSLPIPSQLRTSSEPSPFSPTPYSEQGSSVDPYAVLQDSAEMQASASRSTNKFILSPDSAGRGSVLNQSGQSATTQSRPLRDSMGSAMSVGSGAFDPFERYLHQHDDDLEAELDLSAQHQEDLDISIALGQRFDDPDLSAIAPLPSTNGGFPRRSRHIV